MPINPFSIPGAAPSLGIETTPLIINGVAYVATPYNRLIALNVANGQVLWYYQANLSSFVTKPFWAPAYVISSLTFHNGSIYMMTSDTSVYAFNAFTGEVQFTIPDVGRAISGNTGQYYGEKAPIVFGNLIIVRASTTDYGGRGFVAAYNLVTHNLAWIWYSVPPAGGDPNWDNQSSLGNIQSYPNDWGSTSLIGGGAAWGIMALDEQTGVLYFSTGHPSGIYDASLRPGPNLYSDSVIALNSSNGRMLWYYQINPHDVTEHEGGWSITLANIAINGQSRKVVIQAAKSNYIYVLDAANGKPVYDAIHIGPQSANSPNDNGRTTANLTLSQSVMLGKRICPGPDGGIEMSPAIDGNNLFVVTQNACGQMVRGPITYKGQTISGYLFEGDPTAIQNATVYSLDLSSGKANWKFELQNRYQGSSAVVSAGVVYIVDRSGKLFALKEVDGSVLRSFNLGGLGASGVSLGRDLSGKVMLIVPAGGGDIPSATPGVVLGFGLFNPGSPGTGGGQFLVSELPVIVLGAVVVVLTLFILLSRGKKRPDGNQGEGPILGS